MARVIQGQPEKIIHGASIAGGGLAVNQSERTHFTEGDPSEEKWSRKYNREPHPDLLECFKALAPHAIEISYIDAKKVKDNFFVTGFSVKDWEDDAKATLHLQCKFRATDGIMVPLSCPNINMEATAYKNKTTLNSLVNELIEEVRLYVFAGKSAEPWTLFDSPSPRIVVDQDGELKQEEEDAIAS